MRLSFTQALKKAPPTAAASQQRQAFASLLIGCFALGLLHIPFFAPFIEQIRSAVIEGKGEVLRVYMTQIKETFWTFLGVQDLWQQKELLEEQLMEARFASQRLPYLLQENEELRQLLKVPIPPGFTVLGARILVHQEGQTQTFLLNVGAEQGVQQDAAVIGPTGLLGRVIRVGKRESQALRITDSASRLPVVFLPSKGHAVLIGDISSAVRIELLPEPLPETPQDVVTSEIPGVFPGGLVIGQIEEGIVRVTTEATFLALTHVGVLISEKKKASRACP
ncbi:MAG: rod shape-determining protein MreC [Holosporales bacterium]|jgi:rod shape-determining protein MreC|nr:rod shape-determining protein MreC [Holosporales bacterium]